MKQPKTSALGSHRESVVRALMLLPTPVTRQVYRGCLRLSNSCLWLLLALAACRQHPTVEPDAALLTEAREALGRRDRRLDRYRVTIETAEAGQRARHTFAFRAPNRMRGDVLEPQTLTLSFDGTSLFKRGDALEVVTLDASQPKAAELLTNTFKDFVPEGFRTPLLPASGVRAKVVTHPKASRAIELSVMASPTVGVSYVLRMPAGDFLLKTLRAGDAVTETRVDDETCADGLCVPKVVTVLDNGQPTTTMTVVETTLGAELPAEHFVLRAPDGASIEGQGSKRTQPRTRPF